MKISIFGAAHVCLLATLASTAQVSTPASIANRLDTIVQSYTANNAFMGEVLVVDGDHNVLEKGYGMASLEWNVPHSPVARFRICSLTKQFTAALILLMQQDGKLRITDPISKYLPQTPANWATITLADLLAHTSGIPDIISDKSFPTWSMSPHTPADQLALIRDKPLDFPPGTRFNYSNSNYLVLGLVLEAVSGKSYVDLLRERIFDPLGMHDSGLDTDSLLLPNRVQGYNSTKTGVVLARPMSISIPWAAGSIYSTTGDLLRWEHELFVGHLLSPASLEAMTTPGASGFGLGVEVHQEDGLKVVEHSGGMEGFSTHLTYVPQRRLAVIVLSNVYPSPAATMAQQLLDVTLGKPVILASERKPVPIAVDQLARFNGVYDVGVGFAITITTAGGSLRAQGTGQSHPMTLMYQGVQDGHARFYLPRQDAEIEFIPDASGKITALILHQGGLHTAPRR